MPRPVKYSQKLRERRLEKLDSTPIPSSSTEEPPKAPSLSSTIVRGLRSAQKYSAYAFSAFASMHLFTVGISPCISLSLADASLMVTRTFYQSTVGEATLVWGSLAVHILSGLVLHLRQIYRRYKYYDRLNLGLTPLTASGLVLSGLVCAHAIINRIAPKVVSGDSSLISLEYVSWALAHSGLSTASFLVLMTSIYVFHASLGFKRYFKQRPGQESWLAAGAGAIASLALYKLSLRQIPAGWLASQFAQIHDYGMRLMTPF